MNEVTTKLLIFFDDPFWVGVIEHNNEGELSVCKIIFGAEPKDYEVFEYIQKNYWKFKFSPTLKTEKVEKHSINPKRLQRKVKKQLKNVGIGTKSQQALKLQQEQEKLERRKYNREKKEAEKEFQFQLKQQKRKQKHKGR